MGAGALFLERASPPCTWWSGFDGGVGERELWVLCVGGRYGVWRDHGGSAVWAGGVAGLLLGKVSWDDDVVEVVKGFGVAMRVCAVAMSI